MKNKKRIIAAIALTLVVIMLAVSLTACGPSSMESAVKKMEKKGYTQIPFVGLLTGNTVAFSKGLFGAKVYAVLYPSFKEADEAAKEMKEENAKQAGKWVIWGDEQAVKDFRW